MPGGRLTQQDRQQIAAGLAEGLSQAEIARRLARPTSTISREVTRNSGSGGYRADQAHRATERRARRRKPSQVPAPPATAGTYGRDPGAVRDFEELLTALLVQMGLPRMIARVLTCLSITDTGSLTSAELVQRLEVSPASISKAVSYLEGQQLVRREHDGFRRRERYIVDGDFWYRAWIASAQTNAVLAQAARQGAEILGAATPAGGRLADMGQFLEHVGADMLQRAEYWRDALSARQPADNYGHGDDDTGGQPGRVQSPDMNCEGPAGE